MANNEKASKMATTGIILAPSRREKEQPSYTSADAKMLLTMGTGKPMI